MSQDISGCGEPYNKGGAVFFTAEEEPGESDRASDSACVGLPRVYLGRLETAVGSTAVALRPRRGHASRERWPQQRSQRQLSQHG